jgi:hypothetical protein
MSSIVWNCEGNCLPPCYRLPGPLSLVLSESPPALTIRIDKATLVWLAYCKGATAINLFGDSPGD